MNNHLARKQLLDSWLNKKEKEGNLELNRFLLINCTDHRVTIVGLHTKSQNARWQSDDHFVNWIQCWTNKSIANSFDCSYAIHTMLTVKAQTRSTLWITLTTNGFRSRSSVAINQIRRALQTITLIPHKLHCCLCEILSDLRSSEKTIKRSLCGRVTDLNRLRNNWVLIYVQQL